MPCHDACDFSLVPTIVGEHVDLVRVPLDLAGKLPHRVHGGQVELEAGVGALALLEVPEDGLEGLGSSAADDDAVAEPQEGLDGLPTDAAVPAGDDHGLTLTSGKVIWGVVSRC